MDLLHRLAKRESLVLVAIVASAVTLQVRQHVSAAQEPAARVQPSHAAPICEPSSAQTDTPRMQRADCSIRAHVRPTHPAGLWV
ncbi:hypothetical protein QCE63_05470 [Caballeronia sp. LZ065]|uniref:hypothetical protein n=1 Tax=Caballeronia sp. LZ065 TaxID=3038571 RepID=UPI0028553439|nr:hypothetical protein [Caballeronia sp. LZ065]MDR5778878.1 hypothetical protein [Caballeronia sp. LZ065]